MDNWTFESPCRRRDGRHAGRLGTAVGHDERIEKDIPRQRRRIQIGFWKARSYHVRSDCEWVEWSDGGCRQPALVQSGDDCDRLPLSFPGIKKDVEPLLLVPIGFGAILTNIPLAG